MKQKISEDNNKTVSIYGYLRMEREREKKTVSASTWIAETFAIQCMKNYDCLSCQQKFRKK